MKIKKISEELDRIDRDINRAIDRLDLKLLKNLMNNRQELIADLVKVTGDGDAGDGGIENLIEVIIRRGAIIKARLDDKLRLVRRGLKELGRGDEVRSGYLRGGGYGTRM